MCHRQRNWLKHLGIQKRTIHRQCSLLNSLQYDIGGGDIFKIVYDIKNDAMIDCKTNVFISYWT